MKAIQRCTNCNEPTGRWESGSLWVWVGNDFEGPYCPKCYDGRVCSLCGRPNTDSQYILDGDTKRGPFCKKCCDTQQCVECKKCKGNLWTWQETSMGGYSYGPLCKECNES